jgi:isoamylase
MQQRNFLVSLLLSQGVPMLLGGEEVGRTQGGNNNAYCQDDEISWFAWDAVDESLRDFVRRVIALRRDHPVFRRRHWFQGRPIRGSEVSDIGWFTPGGTEMSDQDWQTGFARSVGLFLNGETIPERDPRGQHVTDDSFLVILNAHDERLDWTLPTQWGERWQVVVDTSGDLEPERESSPDKPLPVTARSAVVLTRIPN